MKKLTLFSLSSFMIIFVLGFSSCAKETCYTCTKDTGTENCTADICERTLSYSGNASGCSGSLSIPEGETHEGTKSTFESNGYTCVSK